MSQKGYDFALIGAITDRVCRGTMESAINPPFASSTSKNHQYPGQIPLNNGNSVKLSRPKKRK